MGLLLRNQYCIFKVSLPVFHISTCYHLIQLMVGINGILFYKEGQSMSHSHCKNHLEDGGRGERKQAGDGLRGAQALKRDVFGM